MAKREHWIVMLAVLALSQNTVAQEKPTRGDSFFKRLDKNDDGLLTSDDMSQERIHLFNRLMRRGDKNGDGKLTKQEFSTILWNRRRRPQTEGEPRRRATGRRQAARRAGGWNAGFGNSAPKLGDRLPDVTVFDALGNEFKLSSLKGHYSVLVFGCLT